MSGEINGACHCDSCGEEIAVHIASGQEMGATQAYTGVCPYCGCALVTFVEVARSGKLRVWVKRREGKVSF